MNEQDEHKHILRMKSGDMKALSPLVTSYQQRALRTAYLVTQDQALAEDACQTALLRAFAAIEQFDISRRFLPWFLRIVVNVAVQMAKKQAQTLPLLDEGHRLVLGEVTAHRSLLSFAVLACNGGNVTDC